MLAHFTSLTMTSRYAHLIKCATVATLGGILNGIHKRDAKANRPWWEAPDSMGPPDDDGRQSNGGSKIASQLVIARGDTAEIFEPAEHTLDKIAFFVDFQIDRLGMFAGRMAGNDAGRATKKPVADVVPVRRSPCRRSGSRCTAIASPADRPR
jgi:hypothetical protein